MTKEELYKEYENLKIEMTPAERIKAYMQGEEVDCIPYGLMSPNEAIAYTIGISKGELNRSFEARCHLHRYVQEHLGTNGVWAALGLRGLGAAAGSVLEYPENSIDYVKEFVVTDYSKLDEIDFTPENNKYFQAKLEDAERMMDIFPDAALSTGVAGPMSSAIAMRRIEYVLRDMRKDPENVHRLLSLAVDGSLQWVEYFYRKTGTTTVSLADPVTTTDILGRKYFDEFSKPYLKRLVEGIKEITGVPPTAHICGHTKEIWPDLKEIGIRNLSIDNCESMREAKESIGDTVFLSGNVSPVDVMRLGTIDMVMESVKNVIEEASDNPAGYMVMTGCQVPIGTPAENMLAVTVAAHRYGKHARKGQKCNTEA